MGIIQNLTKSIFRSIPTRTILTNCTETYGFDNNDKRILLQKSEESVEWKTYSDRIEFSVGNDYPIVVEVGLDWDLSQVPRFNVYRVYEPFRSRTKIDVITITPHEITVGKVSESRLIVYKVIKATGISAER